MWCCNKNNNGLWKRYYKNENIFKLGEFHHVANKFNETIGRAIMETLGKQYSIKINRGSHPQKPDRSTKKSRGISPGTLLFRKLLITFQQAPRS